jgi:colicin import membrane protein
MLMIENHVKRHWQPPLSARPGIECLVNVVQLPTGDVVSAKVGQCNGDDAVRRSIENAVLDASPLPRPPSQAVFSRSFTITFAPDK